jgi:hypothetical protein
MPGALDLVREKNGRNPDFYGFGRRDRLQNKGVQIGICHQGATVAKMFKTREDAVQCNSDAARDALLRAAEHKKNGNTEAMNKEVAWARDCDETATRFANGDYDGVIGDGPGWRR